MFETMSAEMHISSVFFLITINVSSFFDVLACFLLALAVNWMTVANFIQVYTKIISFGRKKELFSAYLPLSVLSNIQKNSNGHFLPQKAERKMCSPTYAEWTGIYYDQSEKMGIVIRKFVEIEKRTGKRTGRVQQINLTREVLGRMKKKSAKNVDE